MKTKIIFLLFILVGTFSCRKDGPTVSNPTPNPTVVDYRDTILGNYIGTMHYIHTDQYGALIVIDTTYTDTISVTSDTTDMDLIYFRIITFRANLHSDYTFADDDMFYYPHGGVGGSFDLGSDSLELHCGGGWGATADTYQFYGIK